mmetsp:Transcript_36426/g.72540  ORF Transcript_36426/g.72540 Transcript_36426/m.72540 type:complete len:200 (-) Transcript_36426:974-1573(-)
MAKFYVDMIAGPTQTGYKGSSARRPGSSHWWSARSSQSACLVVGAATGAGRVASWDTRGSGSGPRGGGWGARAQLVTGYAEHRASLSDKKKYRRAIKIDLKLPEPGGLDGVGLRAEEEIFCSWRGGQEGVEGGVQLIRRRLCLLARWCRDSEGQDGRSGHVGRLLRAQGPRRVCQVGGRIIRHTEEGGCAGGRCSNRTL